MILMSVPPFSGQAVHIFFLLESGRYPVLAVPPPFNLTLYPPFVGGESSLLHMQR